jgi:hypothetical protein
MTGVVNIAMLILRISLLLLTMYSMRIEIKMCFGNVQSEEITQNANNRIWIMAEILFVIYNIVRIYNLPISLKK